MDCRKFEDKNNIKKNYQLSHNLETSINIFVYVFQYI